MRAFLLIAVAVVVAGCGGPYASEVDGPQGREDSPGALPARSDGPVRLAADMVVTTLPAEVVGTATGMPVNCFYVGASEEDDDDLPAIEAANVTASWSDQVPGSGTTLALMVYNMRDHATSKAGPSPLVVQATDDGLPLFLPLAIRVEPNGPLPVAVTQEVHVDVDIFGFTGALTVWPFACLE